MAIINTTVNTEVYIQILDIFLILYIENMFDDKTGWQCLFSQCEEDQSFSYKKKYQLNEMANKQFIYQSDRNFMVETKKIEPWQGSKL